MKLWNLLWTFIIKLKRYTVTVKNSMDNENKEIRIIDTKEQLTEFIEDIRSSFDEIEEKRHSSDENDLCRVAELVIENFGHACSLEEMKNIS